MRFSKASSVALFATAAVAIPALEERAVAATTKYSTFTSHVLATQTTLVPFTVNTAFAQTGTVAVIPGVWTVQVNALPAYLYAETVSISTVIQTKTITTSIPITTTSTKTTTPTSSTTSATSSTPTPRPGNTGPCGENDWCGSLHTCYAGYCYYYATDYYNCGGYGNQCTGSEVCYYSCVDTQNDVNNCGGGGNICGSSTDYGCVKGVCVGLSWDPNNCGKVGNVCASGNCDNYQCV